MIYLTRKAEFSASHFYHNPKFTPEENQRVFGKCNNPNGHGHNYTLEVTVKGKVDPKSGFVVDLKQLKDVMSREVLDALDHRFLNKEVPEFFTKIPTTENPSSLLSDRLQQSPRGPGDDPKEHGETDQDHRKLPLGREALRVVAGGSGEIEPHPQTDRGRRVAVAIIHHHGVLPRVLHVVAKPPQRARSRGCQHSVRMVVLQAVQVLPAQERGADFPRASPRLNLRRQQRRLLFEAHFHIAPFVGGDLIDFVHQVNTGGRNQQAKPGELHHAPVPARPCPSVERATMGTMTDSMAQPAEGLV